jgi:PAS domain S-box-containing protein
VNHLLSIKVFRLGIFYLLCAVGLSETIDAHAAESTRPKRVLIISTGSSFAPGFRLAEQNAIDSLRQLESRPLEFYSESLDIARFSNDSYSRLFRDYLGEKYLDYPPDVVLLIYVGNLVLAEKLFEELFPGVSVVAIGLTEEDISPARSGTHLTGFAHRSDPRGTIELMFRLQPEIRRIVVIGGTAEVDTDVVDRVREAAGSFSGRAEFDFWTNLPMSEMTHAVRSLPSQTVILFTRMYRDGGGQLFNSAQAVKLITESASTPVYILADTLLGSGAIGGSVADVASLARRAGELAHRVLNGVEPESLPFEVRKDGVPMFDWQALKRWGINQSRLPPGSIVRNRPQSIWAQYKWYIMGALLIIAAQTTIIADLLLHRARRRRAESELRESRQFMEMATEAGQVGLWVRDRAGDDLWANSRFRSMFGFVQNDNVEIKQVEARIHPDDRGRIVTAIDRAQQMGTPFEVEFRTAPQINPERWVVARGRMVRDAQDQGLRRMGTVVDITERKQAEERLSASEQNFRTLVETTAAVPWEADVESWCFTYVGPQAVKLLGYPLEQWYEKDFWVSHLHPDDKKTAIDTCATLSETADDFAFEYRMVSSSGKVVWVHDIVNCQHRNGKPARLRGFLLNISERKSIEEALEQSENQVRLFVEHTPASVAMFDRDMRYVITSRRWLKDYNLGDQSILGRSHYDVFPEISQRWKEIHQRCLAGAVETCEQDPFQRRDGTLDWVRWEVRPWYNAVGEIGGIIMFTEVITDRKRAEEELRKRDEWLRLAAEGSYLGVWYWDELKKELSWDAATREMFGVPSDAEIALETFFETLHPDDRDRVKQTWRHALESGTPYQIELRVQRPDGSICWIHVRGRGYCDEAGKPIRMMGIVLDITERKQAETELQQHRAELAHMTRVSTMGEMAASLAHEINQPLTAILSNAQAARRFLAADPADLNEVREILTDIIQDDTRAGEVIRRMRTLVKKEELEFVPLDLCAVISDVVLLAHSDAILHNIRVLQEVAPSLPRVRADRVQLQQVLLNLLLNAFDAMDSCPPNKREILLHAQRDGGRMVEIRVSDYGPGLAADKLEKIFEPFYTTKREGLGVGLSISRSIIEAHGGRLWAENNPDQGATFFFTVPISFSSVDLIGSVSEV